MRYIWINPVTESMYEEPVMEEFLTKHGFTRVRCMVDWGQAVKEKYREMLDGCRDTVAMPHGRWVSGGTGSGRCKGCRD